MAMGLHEHTTPPWRNVRLDTLVRLRWVAVIGQTTAILVVYAGLDFELPIWACLAVIALAAWLNIALRVRFRMTQQMESQRAQRRPNLTIRIARWIVASSMFLAVQLLFLILLACSAVPRCRDS